MSGEIERRGGYDPATARAERRHSSDNWPPPWFGSIQSDRPDAATRKAGELDPEWVMVGVDVPAGKRLYASKDLKGSAFQVAMDAYGNGDGWHLTSTMCHMLVITRPSYGECLAELMRIWQNWENWENEGRELPAGRNGRTAP